MKGCLLFLGAIIGGCALGWTVRVCVHALTRDEDLSTAVGFGTIVISSLLILVYAPFWAFTPDEIAVPPAAKTAWQRRSNAKAESKLQTAELRIGIVFAFVGGFSASTVTQSKVIIAAVTIACAIVGGIVGFDLKRRIRRIREEYDATRTNISTTDRQ